MPFEKRTWKSLGSKAGRQATRKEAVAVVGARMLLVWRKVCKGFATGFVEFLWFGCHSNRTFCWIGCEAGEEERVSFRVLF